MTLQHIQDQINTLKLQLQELQRVSQNQFNTINGILYSGQNLDENGNIVKNPIFSSTSKIINSETQERVLNLGTSEWYQSLLYVDEYVQIKNDKVIARYNYQKNLYTNFDYRYCVYKQIYQDYSDIKEQIKTDITTNNFMKFCLDQLDINIDNIATIDLDQLFYKIQILIDYTMRKEESLIIKNYVIRNKNQILVESNYSLKEDMYARLDENEYEATINAYLATIQKLRYYKQLLQCNLTSDFDTPPKINTYINIFENAINNVYVIKEAENDFVYLTGSLKNVYLINCKNCYIKDCENVLITSSTNILLNDIKNNLQMQSSNNVFINGFQGKLNLQNQGFFYSKNALDFCDLTIFSNNNYIFNNESLQYAYGEINDSNNSYFVAEHSALYSSQIKINNAVHNTLVYLTPNSLRNGYFKFQQKSFSMQQYLGYNWGIIFIQKNITPIQKISFPQGMQQFYYEDYFNQLDIQYGTQDMVQNSIYKVIIDAAGNLIYRDYDNGIFNLFQNEINCRLNDILLSTPPSIIVSQDIQSEYIGYQIDLQRQDEQYFDDWDNVKIQGSLTVINTLSQRYKGLKTNVLNDKIIIQLTDIAYESFNEPVIYLQMLDNDFDSITNKNVVLKNIYVYPQSSTTFDINNSKLLDISQCATYAIDIRADTVNLEKIESMKNVNITLDPTTFINISTISIQIVQPIQSLTLNSNTFRKDVQLILSNLAVQELKTDVFQNFTQLAQNIIEYTTYQIESMFQGSTIIINQSGDILYSGDIQQNVFKNCVFQSPATSQNVLTFPSQNVLTSAFENVSAPNVIFRMDNLISLAKNSFKNTNVKKITHNSDNLVMDSSALDGLKSDEFNFLNVIGMTTESNLNNIQKQITMESDYYDRQLQQILLNPYLIKDIYYQLFNKVGKGHENLIYDLNYGLQEIKVIPKKRTFSNITIVQFNQLQNDYIQNYIQQMSESQILRVFMNDVQNANAQNLLFNSPKLQYINFNGKLTLQSFSDKIKILNSLSLTSQKQLPQNMLQMICYNINVEKPVNPKSVSFNLIDNDTSHNYQLYSIVYDGRESGYQMIAKCAIVPNYLIYVYTFTHDQLVWANKNKIAYNADPEKVIVNGLYQIIRDPIDQSKYTYTQNNLVINFILLDGVLYETSADNPADEALDFDPFSVYFCYIADYSDMAKNQYYRMNLKEGSNFANMFFDVDINTQFLETPLQKSLFLNCTFQNIILGQNQTYIPKYCFQQATIQNIEFYEKTVFESYSFEQSNLEVLNLPTGYELSPYAFENGQLTTINNLVTKNTIIPAFCFYNNNIKMTTTPQFENIAFGESCFAQNKLTSANFVNCTFDKNAFTKNYITTMTFRNDSINYNSIQDTFNQQLDIDKTLIFYNGYQVSGINIFSNMTNGENQIYICVETDTVKDTFKNTVNTNEDQYINTYIIDQIILPDPIEGQTTYLYQFRNMDVTFNIPSADDVCVYKITDAFHPLILRQFIFNNFVQTLIQFKLNNDTTIYNKLIQRFTENDIGTPIKKAFETSDPAIFYNNITELNPFCSKNYLTEMPSKIIFTKCDIIGSFKNISFTQNVSFCQNIINYNFEGAKFSSISFNGNQQIINTEMFKDCNLSAKLDLYNIIQMNNGCFNDNPLTKIIIGPSLKYIEGNNYFQHNTAASDVLINYLGHAPISILNNLQHILNKDDPADQGRYVYLKIADQDKIQILQEIIDDPENVGLYYHVIVGEYSPYYNLIQRTGIYYYCEDFENGSVGQFSIIKQDNQQNVLIFNGITQNPNSNNVAQYRSFDLSLVLTAQYSSNKGIFQITQIKKNDQYNFDLCEYTYLQKIIIPRQITTIGESVFKNYGSKAQQQDQIQALIFSQNEQLIIENYAFQGAAFVNDNVELPADLAYLGIGAFKQCDNLRQFIFGNQTIISQIPEQILYECKNLYRIEVNNNIFSKNCFYSSDNIYTSIVSTVDLSQIFTEANKKYYLGDRQLSDFNFTTYNGISTVKGIAYPHKIINLQLNQPVFKTTVNVVDYMISEFIYKDLIETITITNIASIGERAFYELLGCYKITINYVTIPTLSPFCFAVTTETPTIINYNNYDKTSSYFQNRLYCVVLDQGSDFVITNQKLTGISESGIQKINQDNVTQYFIVVPSTVTDIGSFILDNNNIKDDVICNRITFNAILKTIDNYAFYQKIVLHLDFTQCQFLQSIGFYAFAESYTTETVDFSATTKELIIHDNSFYECPAINVIIGNSLITLQENVFKVLTVQSTITETISFNPSVPDNAFLGRLLLRH